MSSKLNSYRVLMYRVRWFLTQVSVFFILMTSQKEQFAVVRVVELLPMFNCRKSNSTARRAKPPRYTLNVKNIMFLKYISLEAIVFIFHLWIMANTIQRMTLGSHTSSLWFLKITEYGSQWHFPVSALRTHPDTSRVLQWQRWFSNLIRKSVQFVAMICYNKVHHRLYF